MSFFARLFRSFRRPTGFVGRDLEGNRFFEYPSVSDDPRRTKRVVKYAKGTDMLDYVSGHRRLAVQWTSWMTHTRPHPPTLEELYADLERRRRILHNVAVIEAREREDAALVAASEPPPATLQAPISENVSGRPPGLGRAKGSPAVAPDQPPESLVRNAALESQKDDQGSSPSSPWKPPPRDEPHSWKPQTTLRRGG